jgi:hypothetical protein
MGSYWSRPKASIALYLSRQFKALIALYLANIKTEGVKMIQGLCKAELKKRLIQVFDSTKALRECLKTMEVETRFTICNSSFPVTIVIPMPKTNINDLADILISKGLFINKMFMAETFPKTPFESYLDEKCGHLNRLGIKPTTSEIFEIYGCSILEYIETLGIDPKFFCPLQITFNTLRCKLELSENGKYNLVSF